MDPSSTKHAGISGTPSTATQPHTETAPDTVPHNETTVNMFSGRLTTLQSVVLSAVLIASASFFWMMTPWIVVNNNYPRSAEHSIEYGSLVNPPKSTSEPARLHLGILAMQVVVFFVFGFTLVYLAGRPLLKYILLVAVAAFFMLLVLDYLTYGQ